NHKVSRVPCWRLASPDLFPGHRFWRRVARRIWNIGYILRFGRCRIAQINSPLRRRWWRSRLSVLGMRHICCKVSKEVESQALDAAKPGVDFLVTHPGQLHASGIHPGLGITMEPPPVPTLLLHGG